MIKDIAIKLAKFMIAMSLKLDHTAAVTHNGKHCNSQKKRACSFH